MKFQFIREYFQFIAFLLLAIAMPLTKSYLPVFMFLWVLGGVITIRKVDPDLNMFQWILLSSPLIFYLLHVTGVIYSQNKGAAYFDLEVKLTIFFLFFVILFLTSKVQEKRELILKMFVISTFIVALVCLFRAIYHSVSLVESGLSWHPSYWEMHDHMSFMRLIKNRYSHFSHGYLSFIHHPSYFAMYIQMSIAVLVHLIINGKLNVKEKMLYGTMVLFFVVFIWLLGSRSGYVTLILSLIFIALWIVFRKKRKWLSIAILSVGIFGGIFLFTQSKLADNAQDFFNSLKSENSISNSTDIRIKLWRAGLYVINSHPVFGVGTGDVKDELKKVYKQHNMQAAIQENLNVHDQFLETFIGLGMIGFLVISCWWIGGFIYGLIKKNFLFSFFLLIVIINGLFESILNTAAGISFVVLFYGLLFSQLKSKNQ